MPRDAGEAAHKVATLRRTLLLATLMFQVRPTRAFILPLKNGEHAVSPKQHSAGLVMDFGVLPASLVSYPHLFGRGANTLAGVTPGCANLLLGRRGRTRSGALLRGYAGCSQGIWRSADA